MPKKGKLPKTQVSEGFTGNRIYYARKKRLQLPQITRPRPPGEKDADHHARRGVGVKKNRRNGLQFL